MPAQRTRGTQEGPEEREGPEEQAGLPGDMALVSRMRSGDSSAYDELYRRHVDAVRRYARGCCRDADTAEDLTNEVFARLLHAVRGGAGPDTAVRPYLLTTVRRVAAAWSATARREHLVEDFAMFAMSVADTSVRGAVEPGADVRAMRKAERSMAVQAFRSLPERWQTVLWHTTVEGESPQEVAPLLGLTANATAVLAHRAREGLKQAYLQAHVNASRTADGDCARYADRLGAYARGNLRARAEQGLRRHLERCVSCRTTAREVMDVNERLRAVLPVAVVGWFAAAYSAKAAGMVTGAAEAGAMASAAAMGAAAMADNAVGAVSGCGGAGDPATAWAMSPYGAGVAAKAGVTASIVAAVTAAALMLALIGDGQRAPEPGAEVRPSAEVFAPNEPEGERGTGRGGAGQEGEGPEGREGMGGREGTEGPEGPEGKATSPAEGSSGGARSSPLSPAPDAAASSPPSASPRTSPPSVPGLSVSPVPPSAPLPPHPAPAAPTVRRVGELPRNLLGEGDGPTVRLKGSSPLWQRSEPRVGGRVYEHGVSVGAPSSVTIRLNRSCTSYEALAGVDDLAPRTGAVRFSVYGDGVRLWRSDVVRRGEEPVPVRVSLSGRQTVRLVVEPHTVLGTVTVADWVRARISCP